MIEARVRFEVECTIGVRVRFEVKCIIEGRVRFEVACIIDFSQHNYVKPPCSRPNEL